MGEEGNLKYFRIFFVVALVVSLIMNVYLISRINDLEHTMHHRINNDDYLAHMISGQTDAFEYILREVLQEQSWVGPIEFDLDLKNRDIGEAVVEFGWQVNEYPEGAEVALHYKLAENESYITVSPEKIGKGIFQKNIPLTIDIEPHWEVVHYFERETGSSGITHLAEEYPDHEYGYPMISYFVSMDYDGVMKSSPVKTDYLTNYGEQLYGSLHSVITVSDAEVVYVNITHHHGELINLIEELSLITYNKEKIVGEELLNREDYDGENDDYQPNYFNFNEPIKLDSFTHIVAKVVYEGGKVFEKEIYRK